MPGQPAPFSFSIKIKPFSTFTPLLLSIPHYLDIFFVIFTLQTRFSPLLDPKHCDLVPRIFNGFPPSSSLQRINNITVSTRLSKRKLRRAESYLPLPHLKVLLRNIFNICKSTTEITKRLEQYASKVRYM